MEHFIDLIPHSRFHALLAPRAIFWGSKVVEKTAFVQVVVEKMAFLRKLMWRKTEVTVTTPIL